MRHWRYNYIIFRIFKERIHASLLSKWLNFRCYVKSPRRVSRRKVIESNRKLVISGGSFRERAENPRVDGNYHEQQRRDREAEARGGEHDEASWRGSHARTECTGSDREPAIERHSVDPGNRSEEQTARRWRGVSLSPLLFYPLTFSRHFCLFVASNSTNSESLDIIVARVHIVEIDVLREDRIE